VMVEPRNAIVRQYQKYFELEGTTLEIEPDALREIAEAAMSRETGVRAIRSLVEEFLRDILFELPERTDIARYVVSGAAYRGEEPVRCVERNEEPSGSTPSVTPAKDEAETGTRTRSTRGKRRRRDTA